MRALPRNRSLFGALTLAALLLVAACGATDCNAIDPQPAGYNPGDGTVTPGDTYVQAKASTYGPSGGGLFIQVDVAEPDEGAAYNNKADITVWTGSGDDTTGEAPASAPAFDEHSIRSRDEFDLTSPRNWGGGTVLDLANTDTKAWVFIKVALHRVDGSPADEKIYSYTFSTAALDLPSGWQDADDLN
ncbi:MAG: hypothetical protein ACYTCU_06585 [Planctomycetota bacterium]|jgi:hypothetical protein